MNPSASEVSQFGTSSHEVESSHCPQLLLQVSGRFYETTKKKERKKEERKRERQKVLPHEEKKIHIKYPEYVMLLYRTYCVIVCLVVWEKQQRSSALRPSLLCNILKITVWGWDTTWVTTRAFKKFNIVLYNIDILWDVLIEPKVNYRYVVVVFCGDLKKNAVICLVYKKWLEVIYWKMKFPFIIIITSCFGAVVIVYSCSFFSATFPINRL